MKGHVRQRGTSYEVRVYAGKGKTVTVTVRWQGSKRATKDAADRELRDLLEKYDVNNVTPSNATVAQLIARWRKHAEHEWSPTTIAARESYVRLHILPTLGERKVREVSTSDLDDFYADLRAKGLSPATIRRSVHVILRTAFGEAVRWRWITTNPAADAKPPKQGNAVPDLDPPTDDELLRILELAPADFYAFLVVAADTGARRGEVCALRWSSIDFDLCEVLIQRAIVLDHGKAIEKGTKTDKARRITLGPVAVAALKEHRKAALRAALASKATITPDSYVFSPDLDGASPWRPDGVTARFIKLREKCCDCVDGDGKRVGKAGCKDAGHIDLRRIRLHDLRHALVTKWLSEDVDPRTVMGRVGHSSLQTLSRYSHFVPAKDKEAAERLGERLGKTRARDGR